MRIWIYGKLNFSNKLFLLIYESLNVLINNKSYCQRIFMKVEYASRRFNYDNSRISKKFKLFWEVSKVQNFLSNLLSEFVNYFSLPKCETNAYQIASCTISLKNIVHLMTCTQTLSHCQHSFFYWVFLLCFWNINM